MLSIIYPELLPRKLYNCFLSKNRLCLIKHSKRKLKWCVIMKFVLLSFFLSFSLLAESKKPNVIFMEVDDLPAHYVGTMGAKFAKTPTIDSLAAKGVKFTNAVCQGTMCGPARNSLIIGRYPHNIGMYQNGPFKGLPNGVWTLPSSMQRAGYKTAHIGKSHIHPSKEGLKGTKEEIRTEGHRRLGFDYVWQSLGRAVVSGKAAEKGVDRYIDFLIDKGYFDHMKNEKGKASTLPDDIYLDGLFTKLSVEFIKQHKSEPYFLWLNYSVPHGPYDVNQKYHDRFKENEMPVPSAANDKGKGIPSLLRPSKIKSEAKNKTVQKGNCASISFLDDQVAKVLKAVKESGQEDNTIIVFFSDHGILVGEHGLAHKGTLYKEVLNPALVIYDPRMKSSKVVSQPVELLDIVKTTLDWGKASKEDKATPYGESLLPILDGTANRSKDFAVGESPGYYALVTKKYKFIAPFDFQKDGKIILFDLENNSEETVNIAAQKPEVVALFKEKAKAWLASNGPVIEQAAVPSKEEKRAKKKKKK